MLSELSYYALQEPFLSRSLHKNNHSAVTCSTSQHDRIKMVNFRVHNVILVYATEQAQYYTTPLLQKGGATSGICPATVTTNLYLYYP